MEATVVTKDRLQANQDRQENPVMDRHLLLAKQEKPMLVTKAMYPTLYHDCQC